MTLSHALEFLGSHQPLPSDAQLSRTELDELESVVRFLARHPDKVALDLLLGIFGDGSGFGVYQLVEDAVAAHEPNLVAEVLESKLASGPRSVRYWCAQIAAGYRDERLVAPLASNLIASDYDLRYAVVTALEAIGGNAARAALQGWLPHETENELADVIREVLGSN